MAEPTQEEAANTLVEYLNVLRRRKWTILLVVALLLGATVFFSYRAIPQYTTSARLLVRPTSNDPDAYYAINLDTERGLVQSDAVANVVAQTDGGVSSALLAGLAVSVEPETEILNIQYTSASPEEARDMANAFSEAYLSFRRQQALAVYQARTQEIKDRIDVLNVQKDKLTKQFTNANDPNRIQIIQSDLTQVNTRIAILQEQVAALGTAESIASSGGEIVQPAILPSTPSSPNHAQDITLALVLGLALGASIALVRERFDVRLQGSRDLESQLGAPVLATIPRVDDWRKRETAELVTVSHPKSAPSEAYRALRTNLQFLSRRDGVQLVSITSPYQGEGKTTTVANLAVALAQTGKRVIAVSCDLRRPRLHRFFDCSNDVGVTNILTGEVSLSDAVQRPAGLDHIRVLASGPVPANPAELLGSDEMDLLLGDLRSVADYVLLDTPPILAVADGLILGPKSDGIVVVVDASATLRGAAAGVREQLEQVGGNIIGGIFNNFDPASSKSYANDYRTYYPYRYLEEPETKRGRARPTPAPAPDEIWDESRDASSSALAPGPSPEPDQP